ncbi:MAG: type II toxin-antitoxin system Phd/YefM family antitoxin [Brachymonas sp.]|nr:type II toxin-antitoxin system Phd/YefM family antitoxin [Brachymonas sp.]
MGLTTTSSTWQVQEAKSRFSELLERAATEGPQTITRHGKPVAQVVPIDASEPTQDKTHGPEVLDTDNPYEGMSFTEFLLNAPKIEGGLPERPRNRSEGHPPMFGDV